MILNRRSSLYPLAAATASRVLDLDTMSGCTSCFMSRDEHDHVHCGHPAAPQVHLGVPAGTIWTCPMHPQIRRNGPGQCPICGMALEPLEPTLDDGPNPELVDMTRRFWVSAILSVPLVALAMGSELFGWEPVPVRGAMWVQLALATPVVLWGGWPFFQRFWASLRTRNL